MSCLTDLAIHEIAILKEIERTQGTAAFDDAALCSLFTIGGLIANSFGNRYLSDLLVLMDAVHSPRARAVPVLRLV